MLFAGRIRKRKPRRKVVSVVEVILPVVSDSHGDLEVWTQPEFVLNESTDHLLPEHHLTIAALLHKRKRPVLQIVLQRRERVRSAEIGVVIEPAAADVRYVNTRAQGMLSGLIRDDLGEREMVLGLQPVRLSPSTGKRILDDNLWFGIQAFC
jgi:hypothetical protein